MGCSLFQISNACTVQLDNTYTAAPYVGYVGCSLFQITCTVQLDNTYTAAPYALNSLCHLSGSLQKPY